MATRQDSLLTKLFLDFLLGLFRIVPAKEIPIRKEGEPRIAGLHAGTTWMSDDFDDPLPDEFWFGESVFESKEPDR